MILCKMCNRFFWNETIFFLILPLRRDNFITPHQIHLAMKEIPHFLDELTYYNSIVRKLLALIFACMLFLPSMAYDFEENGLYFNVLNAGDDSPAVEVTSGGSGEKYSGEVVIPQTVAHEGITYSVTAIGDQAFFGCTSLTAITFPEGLERIGIYAFRKCTSLVTISLPSTMRVIDDYAFRYCESLEHLSLSDSLTRIGDYAFSGCSSLKSVILPSGVLHYGHAVFYDCASLKEVIIPDGIERIPDYFLSNCDSLEGLTIPESVTAIGDGAFMKSDNLRSFTLPSSVVTIGDMAFAQCKALESINLSSNLRVMGKEVFSECISLQSIELPEGLVAIPNNAFDMCLHLTSIGIPEGVTSVGEKAFHRCSSLKEVVLPSSVERLGRSAFERCSSLTSVKLSGAISEIPHTAFYECVALDSLVIPEGVRELGEMAFCICTSLTTVSIPSTMERMADLSMSFNSLSSIYVYKETPPESVQYTPFDKYEAVLYVPVGSVEAYRKDAIWGNFKDIREMQNDVDGYEPFIVEGKVWYYGHVDYMHNTYVYKVYFEGDTVVDGHLCKKLVEERPGFDSYSPCACREENGKVWAYYSHYSNQPWQKWLLFDFTCQVGDTVTNILAYGSGKFLVDEVGYVSSFGRDRRRVAINRGDGQLGYWLEGVGGRYDMFSVWHVVTAASERFLYCELNGERIADQSSFGDAALESLDIQSPTSHGKSNDTDVFDLTGRRLNGVPNHGFYIRNGRKYVK